MYNTKESLILASASPRRREMLSRLGLNYKIVPSEIEEGGAEDRSPEMHAQDMAWEKASAVARRIGEEEDHWYLAVDTVVMVDDRVLGKPESRDEAKEFLSLLSGKWHTVVTGYCLWNPVGGKKVNNAVSSRVKIKVLSKEEIEAYVNTREPIDKAGAYAVQGIGAFMVEAIEGSYTNVVGLPMTEVLTDLCRLGIIEVGD